jgi:hypothetical protein
MKILVNSNPRTGTTYLINMLRWSAKHHLDKNRNGEYSNQDEWLIKAHEPIILLSSIPNVSQLTIIRDPLDTISSNMFRHTSGLNSNSIWGHTGVSAENKTKNYYDPRFLEGIKQSIAKWKEYADNTIKNKESLTPILFNDLINNTEQIIISVFKEQGVDKNIIDDVSRESVYQFRLMMERDLSNNPNHVNGTDNRLPVSKPEDYYDVRDIVEKKIAKEGLNDLYLEVIDKI